MADKKCAHQACRCMVEEDETYCSDYCRENVARSGGMCQCGHPDCE